MPSKKHQTELQSLLEINSEITDIYLKKKQLFNNGQLHHLSFSIKYKIDNYYLDKIVRLNKDIEDANNDIYSNIDKIRIKSLKTELIGKLDQEINRVIKICRSKNNNLKELYKLLRRYRKVQLKSALDQIGKYIELSKNFTLIEKEFMDMAIPINDFTRERYIDRLINLQSLDIINECDYINIKTRELYASFNKSKQSALGDIKKSTREIELLLGNIEEYLQKDYIDQTLRDKFRSIKQKLIDIRIDVSDCKDTAIDIINIKVQLHTLFKKADIIEKLSENIEQINKCTNDLFSGIGTLMPDRAVEMDNYSDKISKLPKITSRISYEKNYENILQIKNDFLLSLSK